MAAVFDISDILHPLDLAARQHLEAIPLVQTAVKTYLNVKIEKQVRQNLLCSAVRLGPHQVPEIYRMLPPICEAFGIEEPELYLTRGPANAFSVGHTHVAIVINNELLEDLAEDEIQAVLAHECGHVVAQHILYRQMAETLVRTGESAALFGSALLKSAAGLASKQIRSALLNWHRKSELTADRAAVAYFRSPDPMQRALFHMMGVPKWMPMSISQAMFIEQADEFDKVTESRWERHLANSLEVGSTHPMPVIRMRELTVWAKSPAFEQLVGIAKAGGLGERVTCGRCGQPLVPEWRFCQICGTPVPEAATTGTGEQP
jgi:Zn-dependent protease with chaperone function